MRSAETEQAWSALKKKHLAAPANPYSVESVVLDLASPCIVLGGRNGAGKSRVLRDIRDHLGEDTLYLDLHRLCEQALSILRSREDFADMKDEVGSIGPDPERKFDVSNVIGRKYDEIDWYSLEIDLDDEKLASQFLWAGDAEEGDQPLIPYFEAKYKGVPYSARDMGLGEFSVHFLFWILEQYRSKRGLTVLLDEPDAFLPPVGSSNLLARLLVLCLSRDWKVIMTTHSSEMISAAVDEKEFMLLRRSSAGAIEGTHCGDDPSVADTLLARPPIRHVFFVEDESAWTLTTVILETVDRSLPLSSAVVWGKGSGYMTRLQEHFPRPPEAPLLYAYIFDGDKRSEIGKSPSGRWPAYFLPTGDDPDDLFRTCEGDVPQLAYRLNVPEAELARFLDSIEGRENHDWVNELASQYGRTKVLRALAEMWVENHLAETNDLIKDIRTHVYG